MVSLGEAVDQTRRDTSQVDRPCLGKQWADIPLVTWLLSAAATLASLTLRENLTMEIELSAQGGILLLLSGRRVGDQEKAGEF